MITIWLELNELEVRFAKTVPVVTSLSVMFAPLTKLLPLIVNGCALSDPTGDVGLTPKIAGVGAANVAVTVRAWDIVRTHEPEPVQSPLQPVKVPLVAAAVRVTVELIPKPPDAHVPLVAPAVIVHETPVGLDVTVPLPDPAPFTVTMYPENRAVAVLSCVMITAQVPLPLHAFDQLVNV